jgi:hypothetical protein
VNCHTGEPESLHSCQHDGCTGHLDCVYGSHHRHPPTHISVPPTPAADFEPLPSLEDISIHQCLRAVGLQCYAVALEKAGIYFLAELVALSDQDMADLGIEQQCHRKRLIEAAGCFLRSDFVRSSRLPPPPQPSSPVIPAPSIVPTSTLDTIGRRQELSSGTINNKRRAPQPPVRSSTAYETKTFNSPKTAKSSDVTANSICKVLSPDSVAPRLGSSLLDLKSGPADIHSSEVQRMTPISSCHKTGSESVRTPTPVPPVSSPGFGHSQPNSPLPATRPNPATAHPAKRSAVPSSLAGGGGGAGNYGSTRINSMTATATIPRRERNGCPNPSEGFFV